MVLNGITRKEEGHDVQKRRTVSVLFILTMTVPLCAAGSEKFNAQQCKRIFQIHKRVEDGFIVSKCIPKGPAVTDWEVFEPGSCLQVKPSKGAEAPISTPVGSLAKDKVFYVDDQHHAVDVTSDYKSRWKNAAGICYFVSTKPDASKEPRKSGFNLFNWDSGSFSYSTTKDGTLMVNTGDGTPSGKIEGLSDCDQGIGR
jgi:hypothetical protein